MTTEITIAAVGDIMMWGRQVAAARVGPNRYSFDSIFTHVAPYLSSADLTIGNLETPLAGRERHYQIRTARQGYPRFNCPDELAATLKRVGFNVLTTANNHCLDRGVRGLVRTLNVLDRHGIAHTGTFRSPNEARQYLIQDVKGVKVGILAYTYSTNKQRLPRGYHWMVNMIHLRKILRDIAALRPSVDLLIVAMHFGTEFSHAVNARQRILVHHMLQGGADVILGAHPHVLQPVVITRTQLPDGTVKPKVVAYSLGDFVSERILRYAHTECGAILQLTVQKDPEGNTTITRVASIPTWTQCGIARRRLFFRVLPLRKFMRQPDALITRPYRRMMRQFWVRSSRLLRATHLS